MIVLIDLKFDSNVVKDSDDTYVTLIIAASV